MKKIIDGVVKNNKKTNATVEDLRKRFFLKAVGLGGLGILLYSLLPKKAQAMTFGSNMRATDPIGLKNSSDVRINPATEDTLNSIKTKTDNLDTALSGIKTGTDKIISDAATEATVDKRFNNKTTVSTSVSLSGDNTVLVPGIGNKIRLYWVGMSVDSGNPNDVLAIVKIGSTEHYRWHCGAFSHWQTIDGATDDPLVVNLSSNTTIQFNYTYEEI